jgi:hypothetical protein
MTNFVKRISHEIYFDETFFSLYCVIFIRHFTETALRYFFPKFHGFSCIEKVHRLCLKLRYIRTWFSFSVYYYWLLLACGSGATNKILNTAFTRYLLYTPIKKKPQGRRKMLCSCVTLGFCNSVIATTVLYSIPVLTTASLSLLRFAFWGATWYIIVLSNLLRGRCSYKAKLIYIFQFDLFAT